jgi:hypothetical protein
MVVERSKTPSQWHAIGHQNWLDADGIKVSFTIGHDGSNIYLNYHVEEPEVRAVNTEYNSPVWEDSCVEFFFSPSGDNAYYYNFECNAIGTILCGYGKDRHKREHLPESVLRKVVIKPSLGKKPIAGIWGASTWDLQLKIPKEVLVFNKIDSLSGLAANGNFYKCGDKLENPHYLSWEPVRTPDPNFHLSEHFGQLSFQ